MRTGLVYLCLFVSALLTAPEVLAQQRDKPDENATKLGANAPAVSATPAPTQPKGIPSDPDSHVTAGAMTEVAAQAKRLFDAERWAEAALQFKRVVDGETNDDEGNKQIAQYHLAVALYRLHFYHASYAIFSDIADKEKHLKFNDTLLWLSKLASQLPEPADVIERVGKYTPEKLARFNNPRQRELYWQLNYLLGRYKYRNRDYDLAIGLFGKVDKSSKLYAQAQFFTGISYVQSRKSAPALESFQNLVQALDDGAVGADDDTRMRDLAYLSIARTYYSASIRFSEKGVPTIDGNNISAAIKYWNRVNEASEYWLDAIFEESWAYFLAGDLPHVLGNIHTIESPHFPNTFYPEADVLKAVASYTVCHYDVAVTTVVRMKNKYVPIKSALEAMLNRFNGDDPQRKYFDFLREVRSGQTSLSPGIRHIVENTFSDRQLLRNLEYIQLLDEEEARFKKTPQSFRDSSLGGDIGDTIQFARDLAIRTTGSLARERYTRYLDELKEHLRNGTKILADVTAEQQRKLNEVVNIGYVLQRDPYLYGVIKPDDEHVLWPFDGEYWRDELGFYRQVIKSRCGR